MLTGHPWGSFLGMIFSVILVTGLAYLFTRYVVGNRQGMFMGKQKRNQQMRVIQCMALGKSQRIAVIQVGTRYYLMGITEQNVSLLAELAEDEVECFLEEVPVDMPDFKKSLMDILQNKNRGEKK